MAAHEYVLLTGKAGTERFVFYTTFDQIALDFVASNSSGDDFEFDDRFDVLKIKPATRPGKRSFMISGNLSIYDVEASLGDFSKGSSAYVPRTAGMQVRVYIYSAIGSSQVVPLQLWHGSVQGYDIGLPNFSDERFEFKNNQNTWATEYGFEIFGVFSPTDHGGTVTIEARGVGDRVNMEYNWGCSLNTLTMVQLEDNV